MDETVYYLQKIWELTGIRFYLLKEGNFLPELPEKNFDVIRQSEKLREELLSRAEKQEEPVIYEDAHGVFFICIARSSKNPSGNAEENSLRTFSEPSVETSSKQALEVFFLGPVSSRPLTHLETHRFYLDYGMRRGEESPIPRLTMPRILALTELLGLHFMGKCYSHRELIEKNHLGLEGMEDHRDMIRFEIQEGEAEAYHHSYEEERELLDCVRHGRTEEALQMNLQMDEEVGPLSKNELLHTRKLVVVAIALSTRAAIEGGLSPAEAYRVSDFYNQKTDSCKTVSELIDIRNRAIIDLTDRVQKRLSAHRSSSYVEQCLDYISKHYREKILLEDLADQIGISPAYLSRSFSAEMGIRLQDYIVKFRVDRAANLLMYSSESIARIGDYVGFPSQSYFGRVFRRYMKETPRQFRESHKPREFTGKPEEQE